MALMYAGCLTFKVSWLWYWSLCGVMEIHTSNSLLYAK